MLKLYHQIKNGMAERRNVTILKMVKARMNNATLPISFWDIP
jgi:hypothetical protein